jgi:hypothetical protein
MRCIVLHNNTTTTQHGRLGVASAGSEHLGVDLTYCEYLLTDPLHACPRSPPLLSDFQHDFAASVPARDPRECLASMIEWQHRLDLWTQSAPSATPPLST